MSDESKVEVTTETSETSQPGVEINSATPEVEIPVQPANPQTETTTTVETHKE